MKRAAYYMKKRPRIQEHTLHAPTTATPDALSENDMQMKQMCIYQKKPMIHGKKPIIQEHPACTTDCMMRPKLYENRS